MLKTRHENTMILVTQPNHAVAAGYMASHWGNEEFTRIGFYGNCSESEKLADETIFGIAEHDNGWWEWEADPSSSESVCFTLPLLKYVSISSSLCGCIGTSVPGVTLAWSILPIVPIPVSAVSNNTLPGYRISIPKPPLVFLDF